MEFSSIFERDLGEPLKLQKGSHASFPVVCGAQEFFLVETGKLCLTTRCGGEHGVLLELWWKTQEIGTWGSS